MTETHGHEEGTSIKSVILRAIAVIALVGVLLLGAWGIIQIAFTLPSVLRDVFQTASSPSAYTESITVTLPSTIVSGQAFTLSWEDTKSDGERAYQISYSCAEGLSIHAPTPSGTYQNVPCNTSFNFTNAAQTVQLTPTLSNKTPTPATFTVFATDPSVGTVTAVGSTTVTVAPAGIATPAPAAVAPAPRKLPAATPSPKPTTTYVAANRTTNLYGSPDLEVSILSTQPSGSRYTMQFIVTNKGTNASGAGWVVTAELPLTPVYTYTSAAQQTLYPGDRIIYTLVFDAPAYGYGYPQTCEYPYNRCNNYDQYSYGYSGYNYSGYDRTVRITADPQGYTADYNRGNNVAAVQI